MRFEGRDLKPYSEPVVVSELKEGQVYFSVIFVDDELLIPLVGTWVFAGRKLDPKLEDDRLYFQDVGSYGKGIRYGSPNAYEAEFQIQREQYVKHIFEYERALEVLMNCSLRRSKRESGKLIN